jgi:hypothetical protein
MEYTINSFQLLDELAFEEAHPRAQAGEDTEPRPVFGEAPPRIYQELEGTFNSYRLMGQLVEVFLPRLVDTMICLSGGAPAANDGPDDPPLTPGPSAPPPTRPTGPLGEQHPDR